MSDPKPRRVKPLTDEQVEMLVSTICLSDREQQSCDALQLLLCEVREAIEANDTDHAWSMLLTAETKVFSIFCDEERDRRAVKIRERFFGSEKATRRKSLSTRR